MAMLFLMVGLSGGETARPKELAVQRGGVRLEGGGPAQRMPRQAGTAEESSVLAGEVQCKLRILATVGHMNFASAASPATL